MGSEPDGNGRWGHADLAGSMYEWVLDWYEQDYYTDSQTGCSDCANLAAASNRVLRGGYWASLAYSLRSAPRYYSYPAATPDYGLRCARTP